MEIELSALNREITDIIASGAKPVHATWSAKIYVNDGDVVLPLKLVSIDYVEDFMNNYTECIMVHLLMLKGTFAKRVYPYLNNMEMELNSQPISEIGDAEDGSIPNQSERYVAVMVDEGNPIIENSTKNTASEEELNLGGFIEMKFMLINKSVEQLRMITIGEILRNVTGEEAVKALLTKYSRTVNIDEDRKVKGVDMVKANNQEKREHVIIPHGTPLVELPFHIHYKCGGLYSAGLGYYLQDDHWYLFPCFDTTRFNDVQKTLTIIIVPPDRFPGIERTYRLDGDNLVIIATGDTKFRELSNVAQLNRGNGVRFGDADAMMGEYSTTKGNKTVASRAKNNTEIVTDKRPNGKNMVLMGQNKVNGNPFVEYSLAAARQGSAVTFTWQNSNRSLLYPGMPVKVQYLDGPDIKTLMGVLLSAHNYISLKEPGLTGTRYTNNSMLGVFVKPQDEGYVETDPLT